MSRTPKSPYAIVWLHQKSLSLTPRGAKMKRREFITLLGSAAAARPLAARAQQPQRVRRIGALMSIAADNPDAPVRVAAFAQGLQELGWTVGRNVQIDYRWATSN